MSIPDYQSLMLPLLKLASDGNEHLFRDAVDALADKFNLSPSGLTYEKMEEMLEEKNVAEETIRKFRITLERCDFTRFSKGFMNSDHVNRLLKDAEDSILALEKLL